MESIFFPNTVVDIDGRTVNVDDLAKRYVLIFITLKASWCPVCPKLLSILNLHGLQEDPPTSYIDPFDKSVIIVAPEERPFYRLLLKQDAFFIIICPGPIDKVRQIQNDCHFSHLPYHFVVDEDLSLATSIGLRMSRNRNEIWPCVAHISPNTLQVRPVVFGRGPGFYGHKDLLTCLRDNRVQVESEAENLILKAMEVETRLKMTGDPAQDVQQQIIQTDQPHTTTERDFPIELITHIFEYLTPMEIVRTVMATSRLWRAVGLEVILMSLRREIKCVSESLVTYPQTENNQMPYYSRVTLLKQENKLVSIYELSQQMKKLNKIVETSQRLLVYCNID